MSLRSPFSTQPRSRRSWPALLLVALWSLGPTMASRAHDHQQETSPAEGTEVAAAAQAEEAGIQTRAQAEAAGWHYDEETAGYYRIEKVQRVEHAYRWMNEDKTKVQFPPGVSFEVVDYDDEFFRVKAYGNPFRAAPAAPAAKTDPEVALKKVDETYQVTLESVDRLTFEPFDRGLPQRGQWRESFDVADMNGDGELDVVFGPNRKGRQRPNVFLGDGKGGWRQWSEARYPPLPYNYGAAAAGDLNGDGHMDLVFGLHLRGVLAIVSDGAGGFKPWTEGIQFEMPGQGGGLTTFSSRRLELVDWDGDGRLDILALGEGPKMAFTGPAQDRKLLESRSFVLFRNNGDGTWTAGTVGGGKREFGTDFTFGDWNGDGRRDVAVASGLAGSTQIIGFGTETAKLETALLPVLRPRSFLRSAAAADLDGDGRDELLLGYLSAELEVWRTGVDAYSYLPGEGDDGEPGWQRRTVYVEEAKKWITALATGDLDGDGHVDVLALNGEGQVLLFLGDGAGGFAYEESPELPAPEQGCDGSDVHLVDLDHDGRPEVVASFAGEPEGLIGLEGLYTLGCKDEGSIRAWKVVPKSGAPAADGVATGTEP